MRRLVEIIVAVISLIVFMPIMLLLCCLIAWFLGAPVFFIQTRAGLNGQPFEMIKFRTMKDVTKCVASEQSDAHRLTSFGRFLRSTSLDELPELWNVLKGEMSLVGPRPLLVDYVTLYSEQQKRRLDIKPGLTGWTQVNGRNNLAWEEKFRLDVWYVDHRTIWLDIKILFRTVYKVIARADINQSGEVTASRFTGSS